MSLNLPEVILLVGVALVFFGPNKIPELARALGQATQKYREGMSDAKKAIFEESSNSLTFEEREIVSAAKQMGIPTSNRSIEEIADDILANS